MYLGFRQKEDKAKYAVKCFDIRELKLRWRSNPNEDIIREHIAAIKQFDCQYILKLKEFLYNSGNPYMYLVYPMMSFKTLESLKGSQVSQNSILKYARELV